MTAFHPTTTDPTAGTGSALPRLTVQIDAAVSGLSGAALLAGSGPLAPLFGVPEPALLAGLGVGFLAWAGALWAQASRQPYPVSVTRTVAWLNLAWVVLSAAVLAAGWLPLSPTGFWFTVAQADMVLLLALAQLYAVHRAR